MGQIGRWVATGTSQCTGRSPNMSHRAMADVIVFAPAIGLVPALASVPGLVSVPAIEGDHASSRDP